MRIYEVTFDGREKKAEEWNPNWVAENVAVEDGGAIEAIRLATKQAGVRQSYEIRAAGVKVLAEAS